MKVKAMDHCRQWLQIVLGCIVTAVGLILLKHAHVITGGTAGLALSISYLLPLKVSSLFILLNVPFFLFSFFKMGRSFTIRTMIAISLLSLFTAVDTKLGDFSLPPLAGSIAGGMIVGFGLCVLIRHGASLGGSSILALYLQQRYRIDPGKTLFAFDCAVLLTGFSSLSFGSCLISAASIVITSGIVSFYKGKDRRNGIGRFRLKNTSFVVTTQAAKAASLLSEPKIEADESSTDTGEIQPLIQSMINRPLPDSPRQSKSAE